MVVAGAGAVAGVVDAAVAGLAEAGVGVRGVVPADNRLLGVADLAGVLESLEPFC